MKIVFPVDYLKNISGNNSINHLVKIIKIKDNSSIISIYGREVEVPCKLNFKKKYIIIKKGSSFELIEKPDKSLKLLFNEEKDDKNKKINELIEKLFFLKDNKENNFESTIKNFLFSLFYSIIKKENEYNLKKKNKSYYFKDKKKDQYYFFFNIFYFNRLAKIFIKIDDKRNVFLNIFADDVKSLDNKNVIELINDSIKNSVRSLNFDFTSDIKSFTNKINSLMFSENVDIKI